MISFSAGPWRFHLRAAAVIRDGDFVLLHRVGSDPFWALPGGRVELGETAEAAVRREMREELDSEVEVGPLMLLLENLYSYRDRPQHGVELYFPVRLPAGSALRDKTATFERQELSGGLNGEAPTPVRLEFRWFHATELAALDLRPAALADLLSTPPGTLQHRVHDGQPLRDLPAPARP